MKRTQKRKAHSADWKFVLVLAALIIGINGTGFYFLLRRPTPEAIVLRIPHYFATTGMAKPLPQTLDPVKFSNRDVAAAYQSAREIPDVLAQQPCYCYCDRRGHRSLLDCFASKHGADCDICVKEALFALQEHHKGKSPEQIRTEIIQGRWKTIQLKSQS